MTEHRLLSALSGKKTDITPIWIMRQAGRYLPEYKAIRCKADSFVALYKNPQLACEITLQPVKRFNLDAAILFSDILTIPEAMNLGLTFVSGSGPQFAKPLNAKDINNLPDINVTQAFDYIAQAIRLVKTQLHHKVPLIGFTGSPWTLATYMLEGSAAKEFIKIRELLFNNPQYLHLLLAKLTDVIKDYVVAQVEAGADVIQIFDTWGNLLSPKHYQEFSLAYIQDIVSHLQIHSSSKHIPSILFVKNTTNYLPLLASTTLSCISVDWTTDLNIARQILGPNKAIQGNLDPAVLSSSDDQITQHVTAILNTPNLHQGGYIFNLGHGIYPTIDPNKVNFLVNTVHSLSRSN